jgi:hypothetical protein
MTSFDSSNFFSPPILENVAGEVASKLCLEIVTIFNRNGVGTYMIDTQHKPMMKEVGLRTLRMTLDKFEKLMA